MPNKYFEGASPVPSAIGLVLLFVLFAFWPQSQELLSYRREAISAGEFWRVFTGHFVHLNLAHALLNSAGTLLLAFFLSREISRRDWWTVVLIAPFIISLGLWLKQPGLMGYVGFSGVLQGLIYFGVIRLLPVMPALASVVLAVLIGRQFWEQTGAYDPNYLQSVIHGRVMPDAHLFGALTGLVLGGLSLWRDRLGKLKTSGYSSARNAETGVPPDA
jgi:rhomboid family GlyGly-CTERM serine protease